MDTSHHPSPSLLKKKKTWIIAAAVLIAGYFVLRFFGLFSAQQTGTQYVTAKVTRGPISASVSGNGQVISSEDFQIKAKASGEVKVLNLVKGQVLKKGTIAAKIDDIDAQRKVRDAQIDLQNTEVEMEKLKEPPTDLEIQQAESAITQAENDQTQMELTYKTNQEDINRQISTLNDDLPKNYADAYNTISTIFADLPYVMGDLENLIDGHDYGDYQSNLSFYANKLQNSDDIVSQETRVQDAYLKAEDSYNSTLKVYQGTSRSDTDKLDSLTQATYDTVYNTSQAFKELNIFLTMVYDKVTGVGKNADVTILNTHLDTVKKDMDVINPYLSSIYTNLQTAKTTKDNIDTQKTALANLDTQHALNEKIDELAIEQKKQALDQLKAGPDALDVKAEQIKMIQKQNALSDAQSTLQDYTVSLPFDAMVSDVSVNLGDVVASSSSLATAHSLQKLAQITLNEVDVVNVKVGQKVVLTFDAIDNFSLTGEVVEVDSTGTVSQGVVSYGVTIGFDLDDPRIKPGMSVSATLISQSKPDVLLIPSTAVHTQNNSSYVEVLTNGQPVQKPVQTGLVGDTMTEITSGVSEGDTIVTSTIESGTGSSSSSSTNRTGGSAGGNRGGFGGGGFILGGGRPPGG